MDPADAFYQEMDSKDLLDQLGPQLRAQAMKFLEEHPNDRVGAVIVTRDAREAADMLRQVAAPADPNEPLTSLVTRRSIEPLLSNVGTDRWRDEPWQRQSVPPVVVSTRDGFKVGFFPLTLATEGGMSAP